MDRFFGYVHAACYSTCPTLVKLLFTVVLLCFPVLVPFSRIGDGNGMGGIRL